MNIGQPQRVHENVELEEMVPSGPVPHEPRRNFPKLPSPFRAPREPALVPAKQ